MKAYLNRPEYPLAALQSLQHELEDRNVPGRQLAEGLDETLSLHRLPSWSRSL